jgi:hypothetical protein
MHQFPKFTSARNYMFLAVPLPIIRSLFTVHSVLVYVIQICRQLLSRTIVLLESFAECTVNKLLMMGRGTVRNM